MSEARANLIPDMAAIINVMYPVGRTIICDHNPEADYPWQTWEQDFKDCFPLGAGDTYAAGTTGGEATHKLTVSEMPAHSHTVNSHTHTYSNTTAVQAHTLTTSEIPSHTHIIYSVGITDNKGANGTTRNSYKMTGRWNSIANATSENYYDGYGDGTTTPNSTGGGKSHTHGLTKASANTGATAPGTSSSGGGTAHNNMPPYESVCFWTRTA